MASSAFSWECFGVRYYGGKKMIEYGVRLRPDGRPSPCEGKKCSCYTGITRHMIQQQNRNPSSSPCCHICRTNGRLLRHHRSYFPEEIVFLCDNCHWWCHIENLELQGHIGVPFPNLTPPKGDRQRFLDMNRPKETELAE